MIIGWFAGILLFTALWFIFFHVETLADQFSDSFTFGAVTHYLAFCIFLKMGGWLIILPLLTGFMCLGNCALGYKQFKDSLDETR